MSLDNSVAVSRSNVKPPFAYQTHWLSVGSKDLWEKDVFLAAKLQLGQDRRLRLLFGLVAEVDRFAFGRTAFMRQANVFVQPAAQIDQAASLAAKGWRLRFAQQEVGTAGAAPQGC